jgi:hypothetical protein
MAGHDSRAPVGPLPDTAVSQSLAPRVLTGLAWPLRVASLGAVVVHRWVDGPWRVGGAVSVDGLTHDLVGNVGVYQGNGGDLVTGLPLQSLRAAADEVYHQPLRPSVVVSAPIDRVTTILESHGHLADLLDDGRLSLVVVDDPERDHTLVYDGDLAWTRPRLRATTRPRTPRRSRSAATTERADTARPARPSRGASEPWNSGRSESSVAPVTNGRPHPRRVPRSAGKPSCGARPVRAGASRLVLRARVLRRSSSPGGTSGGDCGTRPVLVVQTRNAFFPLRPRRDGAIRERVRVVRARATGSRGARTHALPRRVLRSRQ